ncbi:MAG: 2-oxoglutarate and iron-dependent oxygenase domain-containing protein, partial [Enhydrobacter sp.]
MADAQTIPIIDLADPPEKAARELRAALTEVGFYYVVNHSVARDLIRATYAEVARFHALPLERKMQARIDRHNVGYLPMKGDTLRTSVVQTVTKPNFNEALFIARDLPPDHSEVKADRRFRSANQWPADLPGFRETIVSYCDTLEQLVLRLMPLYAGALNLPPRYFEMPFRDMQYK